MIHSPNATVTDREIKNEATRVNDLPFFNAQFEKMYISFHKFVRLSVLRNRSLIRR